jgi:hypothetical protein
MAGPIQGVLLSYEVSEKDLDRHRDGGQEQTLVYAVVSHGVFPRQSQRQVRVPRIGRGIVVRNFRSE